MKSFFLMNEEPLHLYNHRGLDLKKDVIHGEHRYEIKLGCSYRIYQFSFLLMRIYRKEYLNAELFIDEPITSGPKNYTLNCLDWDLDHVERFCGLISLLFPQMPIDIMDGETIIGSNH